jgi:hypothetical protein
MAMTEPRDDTGRDAAPRLVYGTLSGAAFQREVGADVDKWTDAGVAALKENGVEIDRDWFRSFLDDAMRAAREHALANRNPAMATTETREAVAARMLQHMGIDPADIPPAAIGADVDKWTDAALESAIEHEFKLTRDWLRSLLADAMEAARADERRRPIA